MSNEYKDRMLQLLTAVDDVKASEAALQTERKRHQDQIAQSEADLRRTEDDIAKCRENEARLKRELTDLRDEIFHREDEEVIETDESHVPTEDGPSPESAAKRAWNDRAAQIRQVR
jgi:septal ring factor EnvC (AmiA/AmiB activator)